MTRRAGHNESPTEPVTAVKPRDWRGVIIGCIIICVLGVAVRLPVLGRGGVGGDLEFFAGWSNAIKEHGLANVYSESKITANYPIGFMYLLSVFNRCVSPAGEWNKKNVEHPFKVFLCIGDVAITICLVLGGYKLGASGRNALFGGACYMLNPAIIMITALWGQTNAIAVGIMIAALIFLCSRYWPVAYVLAAFACNTKLQVVPFLPLLPLATIFLYPFHNWKGRLKAVTLGAILFLLTTILLFSPFIFKGTVGKAITVGYRSHFKTDTALSANAWNPWGICMPAEQDISSNPPPLVQLGRRVPLIAPIVGFLTYWHISIFLFGAATAAAYFCFVMRPSKQNLFFSASVVAVAFFFLMCKIHERYLLDAIPLLLLAAIFRPRAFGLCGIVSIISVLNMGWCLIIFGLGPALNLLAPVCVVILGLVLVRMLLVVIAPQAEIKWLWEIGFRRKRWFDLPAIAYIAAGGFWLAFTCPWSVWFTNLTSPDTLYFDELELLVYQPDSYHCTFLPYNGLNNQSPFVEGEHTERGLEVPPNSMARFSIPKGFNLFDAKIGISDIISNDADIGLLFAVFLDDNLVYKSEFVNPSSRSREVRIPLGQAKFISLVVVNPKGESPALNAENSRCAVWMDARIQKGL